MNCAHDWKQTGTRLDVVFVIEHWQGPMSAVIRCRECGQYALIRLISWRGKHLEEREFGVSDLPAEPVRIFLKDMNTGYCDLSRYGAEVDALIATAEPVTTIIETVGADLTVTTTVTTTQAPL